ncbi:helix-turn-helix domain-containing protein [Oceanobacillus caeni]|uniref:helix-turn-helix domain-containing protein n=1 Tax=Oceanobacillus TaxID=182709 RepID=UPI0006220ABC|nr:helix-turn-helix transcriptional regulator [Oceanobacillus caeni]KKE77614.1 transcriptional regulator [Bacilli bacterium VT-13-104]PZD87062.1 XRE family transcriptional regulator [Bacilli bacterium]MBU8791924.1 helix-turn-helix domain-containing protein [Oceanobacillus caeni]MCR1834520.1 helix-turn-helix domain-containing protein [Oceanobacillus caeni]MED4475572.1 helix-turn-helix transcriptional regulator [Oceanobacillus caeni]
MDSKRIGRRIKAFRKLKGYTQIDFAKELNVSISQIGNVERGTKPVTDELMNQIADVLDIPKEEITME